MSKLYDVYRLAREYTGKVVVGALTLGALGCSDNYNVRGNVVNERLWEQPGFGYLYRIEVSTEGGSSPRPFVFLGTEGELRNLDEEINVGDKVKINDRTTAVSLSLEQVLTPDKIRKE